MQGHMSKMYTFVDVDVAAYRLEEPLAKRCELMNASEMPASRAATHCFLDCLGGRSSAYFWRWRVHQWNGVGPVVKTVTIDRVWVEYLRPKVTGEVDLRTQKETANKAGI